MEITTAFSSINWLSSTAAAVSTFLVGGIWYGPLFGRAWMAELGFTEDDLSKRNLPRTFGGSLFLALFAAIVLDLFIGVETTPAFGAMAGFFAGIGWVGSFLGILCLFEMRSMRAFMINAGYCTVSLTVMGLILGIW